MRVLFDECVPRQLRRDLAGLDVRTVQEMGWAGIKNGALLSRAAEHFDAVFTVDQGMEQAHLKSKLRVGLVILAATTTDPVKLRPSCPRCVTPFSELSRGRLSAWMSNLRVKLSTRGGRQSREQVSLTAAAAGRSLSASR